MELSSTCIAVGGKIILCDQEKEYLAPPQTSSAFDPTYLRLRVKPRTRWQTARELQPSPHPSVSHTLSSSHIVLILLGVFWALPKILLDQVKQKPWHSQTSKHLKKVIIKRKRNSLWDNAAAGARKAALTAGSG